MTVRSVPPALVCALPATSETVKPAARPIVTSPCTDGATVIVVDPSRTRTAERADLHVAPKVGTDGALALGVCRALIERGLIDGDHVKQTTLGFDEFAESITEWTAARTAEVCGLTVQAFDRFVDALT